MYAAPVSAHLEKLPSFVMVVRHGSITKAAKALAISQAALSQSLKALEDALDLKLLERAKTGVSPTREGEVLFRYGVDLLAELDVLETNLRRTDQQHVERIRIGTHEALATHLFPEAMASFERNNPDVLLSLVSGRVDDLVAQVLNHSLDIIVTVAPKPTKGLASKVIYRDQFQFYRAKGKTAPKLADLNAIPILTDRQAHLAADLPLSQLLAELGLHSAQTFQLNSFHAAARLAAKDLGIALLPTQVGDKFKELHRVKIAGLAMKQFSHQICCGYRARADHQATLDEMIKHVLKAATP